MIRLVAALTALALTGCSLVAMRPSRLDGTHDPSCTWPLVVDGATVAADAALVYWLSQYGNEYPERPSPDFSELTGYAVIPGVLYGLSTIYGILARSECIRAQSRYGLMHPRG